MKLTGLALLFLLTVCAGCKGEIGSPPAGPPDPSDPNHPNNPNNPNNPPPTCDGPRDPGRVTLHRLNRAEYNNTLRDLMDVEARPADDFPSDDHGYGFDNIADVLAIAPALIEKYDLAAETVLSEALAVPTSTAPHIQRFEAENMTSSVGGVYGDVGWNLWSDGELEQPFNITIAGDYDLEVGAFGQQAGPDPVHMDMTLDGRSLMMFDVPQTEAAPGTFRLRRALMPGPHTLSVAFTNDYYMPPDDRNLVVDYLAVDGPYNVTAPPTNPTANARIIICDPVAIGQDACARQIIDAFAKRAWRRPLAQDELDRLLALFHVPIQEGDPFVKGIEVALHAVLLSPHFLFRVELDPDPASPSPHALTDHELASRLSYFLWSSMPDDALFAKADAGQLHEPAVLQAEVARMLSDEKSRSLVDNFAGQWLYTRALDDVNPDYATFPTWDDDLRQAMRLETQLFFRAFLDEPRNAMDMLDADFTFLNDRLAQHYGLPAVGGRDMHRVTLPPGGQRGGLLTQGSILTVTSRPKRTSPVKRGKWVLDQLLCLSPPPPPPGVGTLTESSTVGSVRQRMEAHRTMPLCVSCHTAMDPIGFAMENYDGVGHWRTDDVGYAIDATGALPDGKSFDGARELGAVIKSEDTTRPCITNRFFTYALGRGAERYDACSLQDLQMSFAGGDGSLKTLITAIVTHPSFISRRGEP